ncbi:G patch domain-containing protein 1 homolog [Cylas formicarius]|uniref:G patch domain-containing protein 1 homolog n=1 Tax=Cylas formicarius TaxID=197179 RepID=UPI0029587A46|nr:G patch domain-containing protein 1 homolog [Cylas formicarius]
MSDSEQENENFCFYGKPLDPYDEDAFPKRRPISVEEQIATDAQGRRRFHGAFTGGFSAGFFNTVGSLEGWTPREFKSTRQEKALLHKQKPEDFMDEEDLGEFGIAPQVVKATKEFSTSKKRKKQFSDGPIPGEPVLHKILESGNETVGYILLKNMGIRDKIRESQEAESSQNKIYGCEIPKSYEIPDDIHAKQYQVPEIYKQLLINPKDNTFGLGYSGLDNVNLFPDQSLKFVVAGKGNKKMSITGQAFGVGAFEEDDDDIYVKEDMNKYDFELGEEKISESQKQVLKKGAIFDTFLKAKSPLLQKTYFAPPHIPHSFTGKHKIKKSRFEPLLEDQNKNPEKVKINPLLRAKYLGEDTQEEFTPSKSMSGSEKQKIRKEDLLPSTSQKSFDASSIYLNDKFISSSENENVYDILEPVKKMGTTHGTEQMRDAARMKMFGPLTRITTDFIPCSALCKRFNVPEPHTEKLEHTRKKTKNLIFEYQKHKENETFTPGLSTNPTDQAENIIKLEHSEENPIENNQPTATEKDTGMNQETEAPYPEIEQNVSKDITDKLNVDQNQDLFKAVFLSSDSESENEGEHENEKIKKNEEFKQVVLSDQMIPKLKPIKEGILSNVNFHVFKKPNFATNDQKEVEDDKKIVEVNAERKIDPSLYGPRIPEKFPQEKGEESIKVSSDSEDEWIEKDGSETRKHIYKRERKRKKHKKKRKKDKIG